MSERLDGGFFSFVLPLIVDSIFHKLMPKIFSPNTIKAIQDPNKTFTQVKLRWVVMICNSLLSVLNQSSSCISELYNFIFIVIIPHS